ncbi:MAG: hypothetical protein MJK04_18935 [Psychrosphaera sp.]|nr:hypothetical protein [Psychrosphaera sp.]
MKYQLVVQFSGESVEDYDLLIKMEDTLEENIVGESEVDGHDMGCNEMNIFIYTNQPQDCFAQVKQILNNMI